MATHALPAALRTAGPRKITVTEYHRLIDIGFFHPEERAELIHGTILTVTPPGPPHASVVDALTELFVPRLVGRALVRVQQPFATCGESEPEPDVTIVPRLDYSARHPDKAFLLVEVADSSLESDRETKGPLYAASGVPEYWIVDVKGRAVEVYSEPQDGRYSRMHRVTDLDERLPFAAFPDVEVRVRDVLGG